jgi:hypothetical protein
VPAEIAAGLSRAYPIFTISRSRQQTWSPRRLSSLGRLTPRRRLCADLHARRLHAAPVDDDIRYRESVATPPSGLRGDRHQALERAHPVALSFDGDLASTINKTRNPASTTAKTMNASENEPVVWMTNPSNAGATKVPTMPTTSA